MFHINLLFTCLNRNAFGLGRPLVSMYVHTLQTSLLVLYDLYLIYVLCYTFVKFLRQLGLVPTWQFGDVYGLEPEVLSLVPRPVCAVLLLFPITEKV